MTGDSQEPGLRAAVFDMNETTLDLAPVRAVVDALVGDHGGFRVWFGRLLQLSMTVTATGSYADFSVLARSALDAVADAGGAEVSDDDWSRVAGALGSLPPYPDVIGGLDRLRAAGWTTVALTNSAPAALARQLDGAQLTDRFDHVISVDVVERFKPAPDPYRHTATVLGLDPDELTEGSAGGPWMVACHDWDLAGARAAGYRTAFIRRPGMSCASALPPPDVAVDDFAALADALLAR